MNQDGIPSDAFFDLMRAALRPDAGIAYHELEKVADKCRQARLIASLGLETPKMLVLSTAHITRRTAFDLSFYTTTTGRDGDTRQALHLPIAYSKGEYGWILPIVTGDIDEDKEAWEAHPDLLAIRQIATSNGCTWIMLDQDGDTFDGLPTYEW